MNKAPGIVALATVFVGAAAFAAEPARNAASATPARTQAQLTLAIPAMPVGSALNEFGRQAGLHIVMDAKLAEGLMSKTVDGKFTVETALKQLLGETGLHFEYLDAKTVTIRSSVQGKASPAATATAQRSIATASSALQRAEVAESAASATAASVTTTQVEEKNPDEMVVTGSHIRGATPGNSAQPVFTLTRQDIERTGAISLGDLFRYIPQITQVSTGEAVSDNNMTVYMGDVVMTGMPPMGSNPNRVSAGLRGSPAGGTLILVNGRRVPRNGQKDGNDAYDVAGVPIGAIERIDVLPAGASAIYGADALGGVINIILRKGRSGTQLRLGHENTFDTDSGVVTGELSHYFSAGRLSGRVSGTFQESNTMALKDRDFTASLDRRPYGGADFRGDPTVPFTPADGSGKLFTFDPTLPGSTLGYAPVPAGSAGQSTLAQYLAAGSALLPYDRAQYMQYNVPYQRRSADASLQFDFSRYLQIALEGRWSDNEMVMTAAPMDVNVRLSAGAPGNPFSVPVFLSKVFHDLPRGQTHGESSNHSGLLGLSGEVAGGWQYRANASMSNAKSNAYQSGASFLDFFAVMDAMAGPNPPILAYDSTRVGNPNAPGVIEALYSQNSPNQEQVKEWVYDATFSGPVLSLPGGKMQLAAGAEYRDNDVAFPLMDPNDPINQYYARPRNSNSASFFAEAQIPVIGEGWSRPGARELNLTVAARNDEYTGFSGKTVMSYGMFYRPLERVALRGSWSEGFKVPTLLQRYEPERTRMDQFDPAWYVVPDPLRGNQPLNGVVTITRGGNPDLRPERSENLSAGVEFGVPGIDGLKLTVDYFRTDYIDRIGIVDYLVQLQSFPQTITRGNPLPGDPAGWAGPVTAIDARSINTAFSRVAGWDLGASYAQSLGAGALTLRGAMTKTTTNEFRPLEGDPVDPNTNVDQLPMQFSGSLFYEQGAWDAGVLCVHQGRKRSLITQPFTDSATRWDLQASYDVMAGAPTAPWFLRDTKISLTIFNVLNTRPPFNFNYLPDNGVLDSRMRRYSLSVVRDF